MSAVDALARLATAALAVGLTATCALPARADELTLPPPVYATTELSSVPLEQIGPSACETLIPTGETPEDLPWHLSRLRMEEVWTLATGKGVRIALIDTGVQVSGSEHTPARRFQAFNVLPAQSGQAADDKWNCIHGTIVASLAGAQAVDGPTRFAGIRFDSCGRVSGPKHQRGGPLSRDYAVSGQSRTARAASGSKAYAHRAEGT